MPLGRYTAAGQTEDAGHLGLELGHHATVAVPVDAVSGGMVAQQVGGPGGAVPGQRPVAGAAQGIEIVHGRPV